METPHLYEQEDVVHPKLCKAGDPPLPLQGASLTIQLPELILFCQLAAGRVGWGLLTFPTA